MPNRFFQGIVHQMSETVGCEIGVVDESAVVVACSDVSKVGSSNEFVSLDLNETYDYFVRDGYTYKPFGSKNRNEYAVFVEGVDENAYKTASMLCVSLANLQ